MECEMCEAGYDCLTIVTFFKSKINLRLIKNRNKTMYFF